MRFSVQFPLAIGAAAALLAACAAPPIGATGAMPQGRHASGSSYRVVYNFTGGADGARPVAGLVNINGTLYGTTSQGGGTGCEKSSGCGTVFSVSPSGQETVLHTFTGGSDGADPEAALIAVHGTLYGTTYHGGNTKCKGETGIGCGIVFSITTSGSENVLHVFGAPPDGALPAAALINVKGTLYGTTAEGGNSGGCHLGHLKIGCGSVYSITPSGSENVVFRFTGPYTGSYPTASLLDVDGTMYGATHYGGGHGYGSIYSVTPSGSGKVLFHFKYKDNDGEAPASALIRVGGLLYGTLALYGPHGYGTVYSITTRGTVNVVYGFDRTDGADPNASLIDVNGTLYGTTVSGDMTGCFSSGASCGTVFSLTKGGTLQVLHAFSHNGSDGSRPASNLINVNGTLYGTTAYGGTHGHGTVFAITP